MLIRISDKTRLAYTGVARDEQRPTVGFMATVWLDKNTQELAAGVEFIQGESKGIKGVRTEWHFRLVRMDLRRQPIFNARRPTAARGRDDFSRRIFVLTCLCRDTTNEAC